MLKRRNSTDFSRVPSRLAHRARPIRQSRDDATLSRLLPPSPPTRGSGCLLLHPAATTAGRSRSSTSIRTKQRLVAHVPRVYLPALLTAPGPSGSAEPTRLCRGCSRPPHRPVAQAASSFTLLLRQQGDGRSFTSIRNSSTSWRTSNSSTHVRWDSTTQPTLPGPWKCACACAIDAVPDFCFSAPPGSWQAGTR